MSKAAAILKRYWGFHSFRPLQEEIITAVLKGEDCIALLPTGGGKSICFQVPALAFDGVTIVISPLIALMNDQVQRLKEQGIVATAIHSGMHRNDMIRQLDAAQFGKLKLLYVSPERLKQPEFIARLPSLPLSLLVVDEAHCISMWGYDFRPAYLEIVEVRQLFPRVPVMALTASATKDAIADISDKLALKSVQIFRSDFLRPNLKFGVLPAEDKQAKAIQLLKKLRGSSIVYVRSRRRAREMSQILADHGLRATYYHAGLTREERSDREDGFFANAHQTMVATNAFGMGIDKSDIRVVLHLDVPESLEAYYQEAGRAGRDGRDAYAILLYNQGDLKKLDVNFQKSFPPFADVKRVYRALGVYLKLAIGSGEGQSFPFDFKDFCGEYRLDAMQTWQSLKLLEQAGWITLSEAYFQPTRARVTATKEILYAYQLRKPTKDRVIRTMLRLYQGIMGDLVPIRERQLASMLQMDRAALRKHFEELQSDGILNYVLQDEMPRITMMRPRVAFDNLTIDQDLYKFRRSRQKHALDHILKYIGSEGCRQQYILRYFDDPIQVKCGICDNCRSQKRLQVDDASFKTVSAEIMRVLAQDAKSISSLLELFSPGQANTVLRVLQYLLNEEKIYKSDEMISLN